MNNNQKFVSKYLSFCKRLAKFTELKKELDSEIEGMNALVDDPKAVNFSKRSFAKLRKFSEELKEATNQVEELQDSTEDLAVEAQKTDFSRVPAKVRILKRTFADLEGDLKKISEDVKDVIEEAAEAGEVTSHEAATPAAEGTEQPATESGLSESESAVPKSEGVVDGDAKLNKKEAVNFSKKDYLKSKVKNFCKAYKNFSEDLENSGDLIEEITDEVTVEEAPNNEEVKPAEETPAPAAEEKPEAQEANFDEAVELADSIADDIDEDGFEEDVALEEVENKEFSNAKVKESVKKLVKTFGRIKKHFDEKMDAIKKDIDGTPTIDPKELTTEEAQSLTSEFKCFSTKHEKEMSKRLTKKFANFSEVTKNFAEENSEVATEDVVDAAADVADAIDATEEAPAEFKEFSAKVRKFIKMFSDAKPAPESLTDSGEPVTEVAVAASPEVIEKNAQLDSTLDTINGKIEKLDLPANMANFAKLSSKSIASIKCFSDKDVDAKLKLIEEFAEFCKEFCDKKNFNEEACPKCGKTPCECPHAEEKPAEEKPAKETPANEAPAEETAEVEEVEVDEPSDDFSEEEETEEVVEETPVEDTPVEENTPAEEKPAEETQEASAEEQTSSEETPAEDTPSDEEVVLKNFSAKKAGNTSYGKLMASLAFMN